MTRKRVLIVTLVLAGTASIFTTKSASAAFIFETKWGTEGTGDGQFTGATDVSIGGSGNVYVVDAVEERVQKFDPDGVFITKWGSGGTGNGQFDTPFGIVADSSDNVYVADTLNSRIQKFDSDGTFLGIVAPIGTADGQVQGPIGLAVDDADALYVADTFNNRVQKFSAAGAFVTKWTTIPPGIPLGNTYDVAVGPDGRIFTLDDQAGGPSTPDRLMAFDPASNTLVGVNSAIGAAQRLAVDAFGIPYVSFPASITKFRVSSPANLLPTLSFGSAGSGDGQFSNVQGLAITGETVYVADGGNDRLQRFGQTVSEVTQLLAAPDSPYNDNAFTIGGVADADSSVQLFIDPFCNTAVGPATPGDSFNNNGISINIADDSTLTLFAQATALDGEESDCSATGVTVVEDSTPPTVTISGPNRTTKPRPKFAFSGSEPLFDAFCGFDGGSQSPCSSPAQPLTKLKPGVHTVEVQAEDAAGNVSLLAQKQFKVLRR